MRPEYDFSAGERGKYAARYKAGSRVIVLDPDVAQLFPDSAAVNRALRALAKSARSKARKRAGG
jgi:hypothetical protein